jgi:hypothetical protein
VKVVQETNMFTGDDYIHILLDETTGILSTPTTESISNTTSTTANADYIAAKKIVKKIKNRLQKMTIVPSTPTPVSTSTTNSNSTSNSTITTPPKMTITTTNTTESDRPTLSLANEYLFTSPTSVQHCFGEIVLLWALTRGLVLKQITPRIWESVLCFKLVETLKVIIIIVNNNNNNMIIINIILLYNDYYYI